MNLTALVTSIINNPDDFTKEEVIAALDKLDRQFEQYKKESIKWSIYDFIDYDGYEISEDNAQAALEEMIDRHDANNGITWQTVEYYLQEYGQRID